MDDALETFVYKHVGRYRGPLPKELSPFVNYKDYKWESATAEFGVVERFRFIITDTANWRERKRYWRMKLRPYRYRSRVSRVDRSARYDGVWFDEVPC
jgi:hypothetical protein